MRILFHCEIIYNLVKCLIGNVAQMVKQACNIDYGRGADLVQHYDKQKKNMFIYIYTQFAPPIVDTVL